MSTAKYIALGLLWFAGVLPASASSIAGYALYEDPTRQTTFAEAQQQEYQEVTAEELDFGPVYSDFWVRLTLSALPDAPHYLMSCFIQADELDLYIPEAGGWRLVETGDTRPFSARDVPHECYVFDLAHISSKTLYLRTHATTMSRVEVELVEQLEFWMTQERSQFGYGFYFAVLLAMIIYNFFLLLVTRDAAYLHYVGYLGFITLFLAEMSGHAVKHLWPDWQAWSDYTPIAFATLAIAFGSRYISLITDAKRYAPRTDKLLLYCLPLAALTLVATPFKGVTALLLLLVLMIAVLTLATIAIFAAARAAYRPGYVMLGGIGLMFPGAVIYFAQVTNVIGESWLTSNILYLTTALEAMILSIALAYRIESLNQEIENKEQQVNALRQRFSQRLIRTVDNERRGLARELHEVPEAGSANVHTWQQFLCSGQHPDFSP